MKRRTKVSVTLKLEEQIKDNWIKAALKGKEEGMLTFEELPEFILEIPKDKKNGDYAINLAMLLTKIERKNPREIASILVDAFDRGAASIEKIDIAGPGFINMYLNKDYLKEVVQEVLKEKENYGNSDYLGGEKINVEFVSANPTGLLHMGNARGAAIGDSLSNVLSAIGAEVTKEYYINDAGNQIENFGKSLEARYMEALGTKVEFPEDGYHGEDILETVKGYIEKEGDKLLDAESGKRREILIKYALDEKLGGIREGLDSFRITYDLWFNESELHNSGAIDEVVELLRGKGYLYEEDGALWLKGEALGEEKDEVLIRSNGTPTYFAGDIAYHKNKFDRGFTTLIDIWGADHHGHVARIKKAMTAIGYDGDHLEVILMQLVRLFQDGDILRMSKRTGKYVTLEELLDDIGIDAARYFFVMRNPDSHLDFDLDLAREESSENPVFYIQYAYARISSILRQLEEPLNAYLEKAGGVYEEDVEYELLEKIGELPKVLIDCGVKREPYRLASYAMELATLFHHFYTKCRVLSEESPVKESRIQLIVATKYTLQNVLKILGVTAPERM